MLTDITQRIGRLRDERHAVILAHNYQGGEAQDIADYVGDSLGLSQTAAKTPAELIVFCGVHFMAETAAILCPEKKVLMPDLNAGRPMANMITPRELDEFKAEHPGAATVTYVNSSAAIKAMSDICCTSANADKIVARFSRDQKILFIPDRNLGHYVAEKAREAIRGTLEGGAT